MSKKDTSKQKILIAGYYGYNNAGDEAILDGILTELRSLGEELEFTVISGNSERTQTLHKVDSVAWRDIPGIIDAVKASSLVIVGGGGLIQDYWGVDETSFLTQRQGGISKFGAPILLAKLLGIPSMFYAVGVGPLTTMEGRRFSKLLFQAADHSTVRDRGSKDLLKQIGVKISKIPIEPDPAFYAAPKALDEAFLQKLEKTEKPLIGVSLRYWQIGVEPPNWHSQVSKALDMLIDEIGGTLVFIPLHTSDYFLENDEGVCIQVMEQMQNKDRAILLAGELDPLQRFEAMKHFDLVLGMRLHSLVGALSSGTPSVGLIYDPKVKALLEAHDLGQFCLPLSSLNGVQLSSLLTKAFQEKQYYEAAAKSIQALIKRPSACLKSAKQLLQVNMSEPMIPPLLMDFAIHQTLNLAKAEDQMTQLNTLFQELWSGGEVPGEASELLTTNLGWIGDQLQADQTRLVDLDKELGSTKERLRSSEIGVKSLEKIVHKIESELKGETERRKSSEVGLATLQKSELQLRSELEAIKGSRGFKMLQVLWGIIWRIRDPKRALRGLRSLLGRIFWSAWGRFQRFSASIGMVILKLLPGPRKYLEFLVKSQHIGLEDNSQVTLYTDSDELFPDYQPRFSIRALNRNPVKVTLVTTIRDEAHNAKAWLKQLELQSRVPDEVILLEGGSKDNTFEILTEYARISPLNLKLSSTPGTNIATRRNMGTEMASHPIIAMTDFGCSLQRDWLEKILVPFEHDPQMEVVAGWYQATSRSRLGEWAKDELIPTIEDVHPQSFLPACRSIAFKKSAWERVGRFADWLTKTGEDTYFDLQLKRKVRNWAFVPDAQVVWHAPSSIKGIWDKLSSWTVGDGESGAFAPQLWEQTVESYRSAILTFLGFGLAIGAYWVNVPLGIGLSLLWLALVLLSLRFDGRGEGRIAGGILKRFGRAARVDGFLRGFTHRPEVVARRYADVTGVALFLSGVPIDDTGGGARGTQIALELLRRDNLVIFVHKFPKQESVDLELDFTHEHLLHFALDDFDWDALQWELSHLLKRKILTAILEFPFNEYLPIARSVASLGGQVVYDLIDEWGTSLGAEWYSPRTEQRIVDRSELLVASAPDLVERLEEMSGRSALLLPNAVNLNLFNRALEFEVPDDLPEGDPIILYIGALWGEWFDWDLLGKIARSYPDAALTVIGDYRGQSPFTAPNAHFLGLKPQVKLPAYLKHSDVTIIPWEISPITQATSPLKVFEYLAMGVPVVAPKINPLLDLPYVYLSENHDEFIENIERARSCVMDEVVLDEFNKANSWQARIDELAMHIGGI